MTRDRVLRVVLALVGVLFVLAIFPTVGGIQDPAHSDTGDTMMMGIYATLGVFLLIAAWNPARHRSLIIFAACANLAHAVVTSTLGFGIPSQRSGFVSSSAVLAVIGVLLLVLTLVIPRSEAPRNLLPNDRG